MLKINFEQYNKEKHFNEISSIFMEYKTRRLWSNIEKINCISELEYYLERNFKNFYYDFFVIIANKRVIGFIYSHNVSLNAGHMMITSVINSNFKFRGYGYFSIIKFLNYLFSTYRIRKVFFSIYSHNKLSLNMAYKSKLQFEGTLKEYIYYDGKYYDLNYFSITREGFFFSYNKYL